MEGVKKCLKELKTQLLDWRLHLIFFLSFVVQDIVGAVTGINLDFENHFVDFIAYLPFALGALFVYDKITARNKHT